MSNTAQLSTDDIDDLIYACRTDDLAYLQETIPKLASQLKVSEAEIIRSAIDVDEEGLGSRACLLHYPAANGKLEMLNFLLSALGSTTQSNGIRIGHTSPSLVNHKNVSGNTPLHWAALNGHLEIVKALVKTGADPTIVNEAGRDAVVEAEYSSQPGAEDCATWMLKECDVLENSTGGAATTEAQASTEDTEGMDTEVADGESSRAATNGDAKEG